MDGGHWPAHAKQPKEGALTRDFSGRRGHDPRACQGRSALAKSDLDSNPSSTKRWLCCLSKRQAQGFHLHNGTITAAWDGRPLAL